MIPEGSEAPSFELPAHVDGDQRRVALESYVGDDVVVLAFYPADFNPACDDESDLDQLDLFTMQKDLSVLAVGPDSVYSHAAFADEYNLQIPLLADTERRVAERYNLVFEDDLGQHLVERAVFVLDNEGVVEYAWSTREPQELPDVEAIKDAISETGGDDTALARYRVGYAHYTEGRRAFTSAMDAYRESDWLMAQTDFERACQEFAEAGDHFDSAVRFVDDPDHGEYYDRTKEKARALWQAADWLAESASKYSSGAGGEGQDLRDDAQRPLENARDIGEPIDPDEWPPEEDEQLRSVLPDDDDGTDAGLDVDIDAAATDAAEVGPGERTPGDRDGSRSEGTRGGPDEDLVEVDDEDLEEIEAELSGASSDDDNTEEVDEESTSVVEAPPEEGDDGDVA